MEEQKIYIRTKEKVTAEEDQRLRTNLNRFQTISDFQYLHQNWTSCKINRKVATAVNDASVAFLLSKVDYDAIVLEGVKEVKFPIECIMDNEKLIQEIEYENSIFNLEEFYTKSLDGAAIVITKDRMISAYSWLDHGDTFFMGNNE